MRQFIEEKTLSGVFSYVDNITIAGHDQANHDRHVASFINAIQRREFTLNESNTISSFESLKILGYFKVINYFQLKSKTPVALCSNVVDKFFCSCNTNKTFIGMSSRHLITRVREHLNFKRLQ